jgi:putative exporter of polyketide antibiotics
MAPRYIYVAMPFISMVLTGLPRLPRVVWLVLFIFALVSNLVALPRGVAIYEAFLHYDRSIPLEQRLAPFR